MALKNKSEIDTIHGPEFINLQPLDVNPLMSSCQVKVFYLGHNRNGSYINRETALEMAKTLRGAPIVAAWKDDKEDFSDHGEVIHIEDNEISFSCKTVPYGFVSPDAEVWFQNFVDTDEFGNQVERTYMLTTGYLWNGQYPELDKVLAEGQPHSMELDEETLDGHWAKDDNLGCEFFIINDAVFSKLCILGDNVEPCFEGSSVTASPEGSRNYSYNEFQQTLFTMMNELTDALQSKGGLNMADQDAKTVETDESTESLFAADKAEEVTEVAETETEFEVAETEEVAEEPAVDYTDAEEAPETEVEAEFEAKDDDKDDSDDDDDSESENKDDDEEEKAASKNSLEDYEALEAEVESLRAEVESLREFKLSVENEQKDALINSYPYNTLADEVTAEVVEHKSEYSLDEIEAKLAILYVKHGVDFEAESKSEETAEEESITTFSLDSEGQGAGFVSELQEALRSTLG